MRKYPSDKFPREVKAFQSMQFLVLKGKATSAWPRTTEGFSDFLTYMGPCPPEMSKPTLRRKDRSKGYEPGNVSWEEWKKYPWDEYPLEVEAFTRMHQRILDRHYSTTTWPRTTDGFFKFLTYMGPCPTEMIQPSLGRIDHSKGYEPGNVFWQEWKDNNLDGTIKGNLARKLLPYIVTNDTKQKMSIAALQNRDNRVRAGQISGQIRRARSISAARR